MFEFRKTDRLRTQTDFQRVYDRRRSVSDTWLIVYGCENGLGRLRVGLSVSRQAGNAVKRARLRRLYREAFRLTRPEMPAGLDLILIPRRSGMPTLDALKKSLPKLVTALARKLAKEAPP